MDTLRIKLKTSIAGIDFSAKPGDVVELKKTWAENLIKTNQAEPVKSAPEIETADIEPNIETPEAKPKRKPRRKKAGE